MTGNSEEESGGDKDINTAGKVYDACLEDAWDLFKNEKTQVHHCTQSIMCVGELL
jgi:hypothetical protein